MLVSTATIRLVMGWLIGCLQLEGKSVGQAGVYENRPWCWSTAASDGQPGATGGEVMTLPSIQTSVYRNAGIPLEPEPGGEGAGRTAPRFFGAGQPTGPRDAGTGGQAHPMSAM